MINDGDYFDFLSKDCYYDGEYKITRKVDRVINKSGYSLNVGKRVHQNFFASEVNKNNAVQLTTWGVGLALIAT